MFYIVLDLELGITDGSKIVIESIKQKYIYNLINEEKKLENFWNFMSIFHENCILKDNNFECVPFDISN